MRSDSDMIGTAVGRIPSGCSILTAAHDGRSTGLLVSWVQQASFEPIYVTVCVKKDRPVADLIGASGHFLLNLIGDTPAELFKHFSKTYPLDDDAFAGLSVRDTQFGPLIESCIAHLGCRLHESVAAGDHVLHIAEVVAGGVTDGAKPYVHIRKNGLTY